MPGNARPAPRRMGDLLLPGALLALLWLLLSDAAADAWVVGLPALALALWAAARLGTGALLARVSWLGLAAFVPYFLRASLQGGWDVARRALRPRLDLAPGYVVYRARLAPGTAMDFFLGTVSVLPGTLAVVDHGDGSARIHVLDTRLDNAGELARLEAKVARVFPGAAR